MEEEERRDLSITRSDDLEARMRLAQSPRQLSLSVLEALATDKEMRVLRAVARRRNLPPAIQLEVIARGDGWVHNAIAWSPASTPDALVAVVAAGHTIAIRRALKRRIFPTECIPDLIKTASPKGLAILLSGRHADESSLIRGATNRNSLVRTAVAGNPSTPPQYLQLLATDQDVKVRVAVAGNPKSGQKVYALLATDKRTEVRSAVAMNHKLGNRVVTLLKDSKAARWLLALDGRLSSDEYTDLLKAASKTKKLQLARVKKLPASVTLQLLHDEDDKVRGAAIAYQAANIPESAIRELLEHKDALVRHVAADRFCQMNWQPEDESWLANRVDSLERNVLATVMEILPFPGSISRRILNRFPGLLVQLVSRHSGATIEPGTFRAYDILAALPTLTHSTGSWLLRRLGWPTIAMKWLVEVGGPDEDELCDILADFNGLPPALESACCGSPRVRQRLIAATYGEHPGKHRILAEDPSPTVRRALAANKFLTPETIVILDNDRDTKVQAQLLSEYPTPERLRRLAFSRSTFLKIHVAKSRNLPRDAREILLQSKNAEIQKALASNPPT